MEINNILKKYALMPIIRQTGWSHGLWQLEREYDIVAYVVMECFLYEERIRYDRDGSRKSTYRVCFEKEEHDFSTLVKPNYYDQTNVCTVDKIFDTLEETKIYETEKNNELINKYTRYMYGTIEENKKMRNEYIERIESLVNEAEKRRENPKTKIKRA